MKINKVVVIGSGTMGSGIAHCFAQYKFEICLFDVSGEKLNNANVSISSLSYEDFTKKINEKETKDES